MITSTTTLATNALSGEDGDDASAFSPQPAKLVQQPMHMRVAACVSLRGSHGELR
jgi:hypothetical protein